MLVDVQDDARSGDELVVEDVVAGPAVDVGEEGNTAAEGETADTDVCDATADYDYVGFLEGRVDVEPAVAWPYDGGLFISG